MYKLEKLEENLKKNLKNVSLREWLFFYFVVVIFSSSFFPSPSFPSFLLFFPLFFATLLFVYKNEFVLIMRIRISLRFFFFWIQFLPAAGGDSREIIVETCGFGKKIRSEKIRRFFHSFCFSYSGSVPRVTFPVAKN